MKKRTDFNKTTINDVIVVIVNSKYSFHRYAVVLTVAALAVFVTARILGVK